MDKKFWRQPFHGLSHCIKRLFSPPAKPVHFFSGPSMPDPILDLFKTAWAAYEEGNSCPTALALTEIVLASDDGNYPVFILMRAHLLMALCLIESNDVESAEEHISQGLGLGAEDPESVFSERLQLLGARANLRFRQGKRNGAWITIKETLALAESSPFLADDKFRLHVLAPAYYNLAIVSFENEFYKEAARCYSLAHAIWSELAPEGEYVLKSEKGLQAAQVMLLENIFHDDK